MVVAAARPAKVTIATSLGPVLAKLDGVVADGCVEVVGAGDWAGAAGAVGVAGDVVGAVCAVPGVVELLPLPFGAVFDPPPPVTGFGAVELSAELPLLKREMPLGLLGGALTFGLPM